MRHLEYYILLALADGPLHGYAIKQCIATDSGDTIDPLAGTLYRVIARLMTSGLVRETPAPAHDEPHPGLDRRYYALTPPGRRALAAEAGRLKRAAAAADKRLGNARVRP